MYNSQKSFTLFEKSKSSSNHYLVALEALAGELVTLALLLGGGPWSSSLSSSEVEVLDELLEELGKGALLFLVPKIII